uniref:Uncharacterized protein n=1 Tax=Rhizophora mucronata TaxID=61149 RepID=A0A2P2IVU0_RHIMU
MAFNLFSILLTLLILI